MKEDFCKYMVSGLLWVGFCFLFFQVLFNIWVINISNVGVLTFFLLLCFLDFLSYKI